MRWVGQKKAWEVMAGDVLLGRVPGRAVLGDRVLVVRRHEKTVAMVVVGGRTRVYAREQILTVIEHRTLEEESGVARRRSIKPVGGAERTTATRSPGSRA